MHTQSEAAEFNEGRSLIQNMPEGSRDEDSPMYSDRSAQILTRNPDFVPTGFPAVDWQSAMKRAIRSSADLRQALSLPDVGAGKTQGEASFPTFVPWEFLSRIRPGDPDDPLLRQVLPIQDEDQSAHGFSTDPVGDLNALAAGGLLHKYNGRALVIATGACGVHCRYCFRREFPYSEAGSTSEQWRPAIDYVRRNDDIEEVLLSGGDPLTLTDTKLDQLISEIESIRHVRRLRIHSRMPIVIPQRVTSGLVERLRSSRLAVWMVVHANHANELDGHVLEHLARLTDGGIPVLNQAVLLRDVNDDVESLVALCRRLINHRVQPYYLHQLDRVQGASHFEVPVQRGLRILDELRERLPGYAVPTYVHEQSGQPSKTPLI